MYCIVDLGSHTVRGGIVGGKTPSSNHQPILKLRSMLDTEKMVFGDGCTGSSSSIHTGVLSSDIVRPLFAEHVLKTLNGNGNCCGGIVGYSLVNTAGSSIKTLLACLECIEQVSFLPNHVASIFGFGKTSGICLDIGESNSQIGYVHEGCMLQPSVMYSSIGGYKLSLHLLNLLQQTTLKDPHYLPSQITLPFIESLKEDHCFISHCPQRDSLISSTTHTFTKIIQTPNKGLTLRLNHHRFMCGELLFANNNSCQQVPNSREDLSLPELCVKSIMALPIDVRLPVFKDVTLVGGTSRMRGLYSRLAQEITLRYFSSFSMATHTSTTQQPPMVHASSISDLENTKQIARDVTKCRLNTTKRPELSVYRGLCIAAELSSRHIKTMFWTKNDLEELGESRVGTQIEKQFTVCSLA